MDIDRDAPVYGVAEIDVAAPWSSLGKFKPI